MLEILLEPKSILLKSIHTC